MPGAVDPAYFDAMYATNPDPWDFATSIYELGKYAVTLAALPSRRFTSALEVGCSIGVLTRQLAPYCDRLLGVDGAAAPLAAAARRCAEHPRVGFRQACIPQDWPDGGFDLVVFSEVLYFLGAENITVTARRLRRCLLPGATVVLVNWLGDTGTACGGDQAAALMVAGTAPFLLRRLYLRMPRFRLDVLTDRRVSAGGQA